MAVKDYEYRTQDNRAIGAKLPISVALAIPVEEELVKETKAYDNVYLNVRTLFRAFHGSYSKDKRPSKVELADGFVEEVQTLKSLLEQLGYTVVIYYPQYLKPNTVFKDANVIKADETAIGRIYVDQEQYAIQLAIKSELVSFVCNYNIPGMNGTTVLMTHYPIDLMFASNFQNITLLETNTGSLKTRKDWNTKLGVNPKYISRIPFNIITLQLFGDKAKLFGSSKNNKLKEAFINLAEKKKWTPLTTKNRILSDISALEKDMSDTLHRMNSVKLV